MVFRVGIAAFLIRIGPIRVGIATFLIRIRAIRIGKAVFRVGIMKIPSGKMAASIWSGTTTSITMMHGVFTPLHIL